MSKNGRLVVAGMVTVIGFLCGCGGERGGPTRYPVSGSVRYGDEPLAAGTVQFIPDGSKGNQGPGTSAAVSGGRYATAPGQGTIGGPHLVRVMGYDSGPADSGEAAPVPLFANYEESVDLPAESTTHDIVVPRE